MPRVIPSAGRSRLAYDLVHSGPEVSLLGLPPRLLSSESLHIRGRSDAGILGRSVLSRASGAVREGLEIETLAAANWRDGARPRAILSAPNYLTKQQRTDTRGFVDRFTGAVNAGSVPLLEGGWTWQQVSMSSVDAEFLASRHFSVAEICRIFSVPEMLLQIGTRLPTDMASITSQFAVQCLSPMVSLIEHEFDFAVLPPGLHLELDLSGLMRGSFSQMTAALCALTQSGIATPNDSRRWLGGLPAIEGGDVLRVGPAPTWPADGPGLPHLGPSPGPTGAGLAAPGTNANEGAG
jgi:HK97 family phage portal protein